MRTILLLAILITAAMPVQAHHCTTWSTWTDVDADTDPLGLGVGPRWYVFDEYNPYIETYSIWFYEESNGLPGLQRADEGHDNTCHGMVAGDTILL